MNINLTCYIWGNKTSKLNARSADWGGMRTGAVGLGLYADGACASSATEAFDRMEAFLQDPPVLPPIWLTSAAARGADKANLPPPKLPAILEGPVHEAGGGAFEIP